ncbi:MAG: 6-bladed beta-propeller [Candidatus Aminicenantes bacterium]|nr:6-bladed beta-propeller [Candidatus Aminicenantes bacterium]
MKNKIVLLVLALTVFILYLNGMIAEVHNTKKEIDACMGKVQLTLVRTWGGDEEEDENKFFKYPWDIVIDNKGMVYICDEGNHRIQVFDEAGNYKHSIGKRGNGPTDLLNPNALSIDIRGNLLVSDSMNYRIQILTLEGEYIGGFKIFGGRISDMNSAHKKDEIVVYSHMRTFLSRKLLFVYDKKGKTVREIGKYVNNATDPAKGESVVFAIGENDDIYTAYYSTPYLLVFNYTGNIKMLITYETPFEPKKVRLDKSRKNIEIEGNKYVPSALSLALDSRGRIYIAGKKRHPTKKEASYFQSTGIRRPGSGISRIVPAVENVNTDLYRIIIFDPSGKVIAAAQLNVFLDKIYIHGDRLFIIDTFKGMKIYEYKIDFR